MRSRTVDERPLPHPGRGEHRARPWSCSGPDTAAELFAAGSAVGQTVTIDGADAHGHRRARLLGRPRRRRPSHDDTAVVPDRHRPAAHRRDDRRGRRRSTCRARSEATLSAAYQEINALLLNLHDISADEADFTITSQESLLETATSTNRTLTVLLGGVAAISLLVGGIGVMNIMLVSVTERIREIGLRKALGRHPAVIRRQFLVEASCSASPAGCSASLLGGGRRAGAARR